MVRTWPGVGRGGKDFHQTHGAGGPEGEPKRDLERKCPHWEGECVGCPLSRVGEGPRVSYRGAQQLVQYRRRH